MTLRNQIEFDQALAAVDNLKRALAELRRDVTHPDNFALFAEGYVNDLSKLESEINEFIGLQDAQASLWLRVKGEGIDGAHTPSGVLTNLVDALRKGLQTLTEFILRDGKLLSRPTKTIQQAVEVNVAALAVGSLRIGINITSNVSPEMPNVESFEEAARKALKTYLTTALQVTSDDTPASDDTPPALKRLALAQLMQLAPSGRGIVDSIEIDGRSVPSRRRINLTRASRAKISAAIDQADQTSTETVEEHTGELRELNLDNHTGIVRKNDATPPVSCEFSEDLMGTVRGMLGRSILVRGSRPTTASRKQMTLIVTQVEIIDGDDEQ